MSYANPNVLTDTELVLKNISNKAIQIVEVDYDPENAYRQGHIQGASLIWWKRDINDPIRRDIIRKHNLKTLCQEMALLPNPKLYCMVILTIGLQPLCFGFSSIMDIRMSES